MPKNWLLMAGLFLLLAGQLKQTPATISRETAKEQKKHPKTKMHFGFRVLKILFAPPRKTRFLILIRSGT
jgi:hypothetical protein